MPYASVRVRPIASAHVILPFWTASNMSLRSFGTYFAFVAIGAQPTSTATSEAIPPRRGRSAPPDRPRRGFADAVVLEPAARRHDVVVVAVVARRQVVEVVGAEEVQAFVRARRRHRDERLRLEHERHLGR